jgi:hypothetical protein
MRLGWPAFRTRFKASNLLCFQSTDSAQGVLLGVDGKQRAIDALLLQKPHKLAAPNAPNRPFACSALVLKRQFVQLS